jgi:TELO2-interacting protein 1
VLSPDSLICDALQVIIEGIGVFGMILGKDFADSGFVHSSLYLLLRKLISSSSEIRITSDAVLKCLSISSGYISVSLYFSFFFVFVFCIWD